MQKHKKHADGLSDSSSIGSIMDDTDQEVSSLTDRAFRSLCIAEEENINPVISQSPDMTLQFSSKSNQGSLSHTLHNSNIFNKYSSQSNDYAKSASAFKQLPRFAREENDSKYKSGMVVLPVPDLRNKKQRSKVSSLIKTFDNIENEHPWSSPLVTRKLCIPKSSQKFKLYSEKESAPWDNATVMINHKELSEFSQACQVNYWLNDKYDTQRRRIKTDLENHAQDGLSTALMTTSHISASNFYNSPQRTRKHRTGENKELTNTSNFLHSEHSAFKSWSDHRKKLTGKEKCTEFVPIKEFLNWHEDSPSLNVIHLPVHKTLRSKNALVTTQEKEYSMNVDSSKSSATKLSMLSRQKEEAVKNTGPTISRAKRIKEVLMEVSSSPPSPSSSSSSLLSCKKTTVSCQEKEILMDIGSSYPSPSNKPTAIPMATNQENEILIDMDPLISSSSYSNTTTVLNQDNDILLEKGSSPSSLSTSKTIVPNHEMSVLKGLSSSTSVSYSKRNMVPHQDKDVFMDVGSPVSSELWSKMTSQEKDILMDEDSSSSSSFNKRAVTTNQQKDVHMTECFSLSSLHGKKINAKHKETKVPVNADYSLLISPVIKRTGVTNQEKDESMDISCSSLTKGISNRSMTTNQEKDTKITGESSPLSLFTKKILARKEEDISEATSSFESGEVQYKGKSSNSEPKDELGNNSAPWRRSKVSKSLEISQQISNEKQKPKEEDISMFKRNIAAGAFANEVNMQSNWTESDNSTFNILQLLTPIIQRKHTRDSLEDQTVLITPPLTEFTAIKEQEYRGVIDYKSHDNYKSKAPSLLFNLKDVRKRVKSTYSTSPLLKNMDDKAKLRENVKQENVKPNITTHDLLGKSSKQNVIKESIAYLPAVQTLNSQENGDRNGKIDLCTQLTDNYLTLSSPRNTDDSLFHHNSNNLQHEYPNTQEMFEDTELSKKAIMFGHQINEQNLRKNLEYPSLNLYKKDNRELNAEQQMERNQEHNQLQTSVVRDYAIKESSEKPNLHHNRNVIPLSHVSQTEEILFNERQIVFESNNENIDKRSAGSSKQPYLSLDDDLNLEQQEKKSYYIKKQMSGEKSGKNVAGGQESKEKCKDEGKDELQYYALSNYSTKLEDSEIKMLQYECQQSSKDNLMGELSDKQEDNCPNSVTEKVISKGSSSEVPQRASSASLKLNMFTVKDNTFKSSPIIKAVKLPLLRSMSEDLLICGRKKTESQLESTMQKEKSIFKELQDITNDHETEQSLELNVKSRIAKQTEVHKNTQGLRSNPVVRIPILEETVNFSLQKLKEDVDNSMEMNRLLEVAEKSNEKRRSRDGDEDKPKFIKAKFNSVQVTSNLDDNMVCSVLNSDADNKILNGTDQTVLNQSSLLKNKINEEIINSPTSSALEGRIYSPITSRASDSVIHFDDTNSFLEDVARSSITSPMSESISYSIVTNPVIEKILCSTVISPMSENNISCSMIASPISEIIPNSTVTDETLETISHCLAIRSSSENVISQGETTASEIAEDNEKLTMKNIASKTKGQSTSVKEISDNILNFATHSSVPKNTEGNKSEHERSQSEHERSHLIDNAGKMSGKPPTVPPKTEKALRRAKRLNNKRRKTEAQKKHHIENIDTNSVLSMPSPKALSPPPLRSVSSPPSLAHLHSSYTPTDPNVFRYANTQALTPTPSFPMTQRKLLQDPDSGQYFMVDIPVQIRLKTFYDPETGKYIQMSVPSSDSNLSHASSLEVLNTPYIVCPSFLPLPVTSLTPMRSSSQLSAPATLMLEQHKEEQSASWNRDHTYSEYIENQPYIEPVCDSHSQSITGTPYSPEKDFTDSRGLDIISISDLDDFAIEGLS
ncbi:cardiac-enriched FHL2-interacting protein [Rhinatrema bivittatum]|uniref:cardiac-enriched FHL2-interacting protein n=1 Tax=Rhinatrema bivittatum TaxID=194408 RepID=UPI001128E8FF|nr:cardiac-enriched FHL2-interacting protein [Rhinatrema bivittatum]XP_029465481.1 cardiac-enriched FHL2-interacting protein [Rhinatrema bivittatum]